MSFDYVDTWIFSLLGTAVAFFFFGYFTRGSEVTELKEEHGNAVLALRRINNAAFMGKEALKKSYVTTLFRIKEMSSGWEE